MTELFMIYDEDMGKKAGGGESLSEGGAYICNITCAIYVLAKTGSHCIELEIKTAQGLKARYLNMAYQDKDGMPMAGGQSTLNAMMGILGSTSGLSFSSAKRDGKDISYVPELEGKEIGLFLQKQLYTKPNQSDGYSFRIRVPYFPVDGKTLREKLENKPAQTIERMSNNYKDVDERKPAQDPRHSIGVVDNSYNQQSPPDTGNGFAPY